MCPRRLVLTCDHTCNHLVGEMCSNEDPGEADAHLHAAKQGPQSSFEIPVKIKSQMKKDSFFFNFIYHNSSKCLEKKIGVNKIISTVILSFLEVKTTFE